MMHHIPILSLLVTVLFVGTVGCTGWLMETDEFVDRPEGTVDEKPAVQSIAMQGTIGSVAYLQGTRFMRVKGYGLVTGLKGNGSRSCPPSVREQVLRDIRRQRAVHPDANYPLSAEELIDSLDTSVVEVVGDIPAGVTEGRTFDVQVSAVAVSPNTRSLAGGYLLPCDLKIFKQVSPAQVLAGRTHARARGPVFINPFSRAGDSAAGTSLVEGKVIGGGVNTIDRRLSLVTIIESYSTVRQVMDSINAYGPFEWEAKTADATSPTNIQLQIPPAFVGREGRFVELVMHLPLSNAVAMREGRSQALVAELTRSVVPPEDSSLSLEGLGPSVVPLIQELYTHPRKQVSYYAARTGMRLGDHPAVEVMIEHAMDDRSPHRLAAIRELGDSPLSNRAAAALRKLLADPDARVRIRAYESLRRVAPQAVLTAIVGPRAENFLLDLVPSDGRPLIYARRTRIRRIGLIGADHLVIRPPLFYADPRGQVVLSASDADEAITVLRKEQGRVIGEFKVPYNVPRLTRFLGDDPEMGPDSQPVGLGLDYSVVLDVLYQLCESGSIPADMKWEETSVEELIGPLRPMGRPESEL